MISKEDNELLTMILDVEKIYSMLRKMSPEKAPGPDEMTVLYFKHFWKVVGADVICAVQDFFVNGVMLLELNCTNITLIPKIDNPSKVSQFRPISLCNVIYKLISKIMADHLRLVLPKLVSPYQLMFVLGRAIQDKYCQCKDFPWNES